MDWQEEYGSSIDAWADQEMAYEAFMQRYTQDQVLDMSNADFDAWMEEEMRLYTLLHNAQIAYYKAIRA